MLKFLDIYLQISQKIPLKTVHELEHRIFKIPDLANIFDERVAKTNGMSYTRGIRFSLVTNSDTKIAEMKHFFKNIEKYELPAWTDSEKARFEAEETEWRIRQRQYFGSFAMSLWEAEFDKINKIQDISLEKNTLSKIFSGMRFCENFQLSEEKFFTKNSWHFPKISKTTHWNEHGTMHAVIIPAFSDEYADFAFFVEWMQMRLQRELRDAGKIYDLDSFSVYEGDYLVNVTHFFSPNPAENDKICKIFQNPPNETEFYFIKESLLFSIDEQEAFHDQEWNVVQWFTPDNERNFIINTDYQKFLQKYNTCFERISQIIKTNKNP